jgi:hypothetical protein
MAPPSATPLNEHGSPAAEAFRNMSMFVQISSCQFMMFIFELACFKNHCATSEACLSTSSVRGSKCRERDERDRTGTKIRSDIVHMPFITRSSAVHPPGKNVAKRVYCDLPKVCAPVATPLVFMLPSNSGTSYGA